MKEYVIEVFDKEAVKAKKTDTSGMTEMERWDIFRKKNETIATFYEQTYKDAIEASIEILTVNDEAMLVEVHPREKHSSLAMILFWDSKSEKVYPLYGSTNIKELPDRQSLIDYCLKMKGKKPKRGIYYRFV